MGEVSETTSIRGQGVHGRHDHAQDLPRYTVSTRHVLLRIHAPPTGLHTPVSGAPVLHSTSLLDTPPGQSVRLSGAGHPPTAPPPPHHPANESPLPYNLLREHTPLHTSVTGYASQFTIARKRYRGNNASCPSPSDPVTLGLVAGAGRRRR